MDFNLTNCTLCARQCHTDRSKHKGFCATDSSCHVASICVHKGEEPFLSGEKGVCNVFFPHCNLACIFCQNKDISSSSYNMEDCSYKSLSEVIDRIEKVLDTTENVLGFVSPSHYAHLIPPIVDTLHHHGYRPTVVYNTNCYDNVETIKALEGYIDIYLPDFKYFSSELSGKYSSCPDYFAKASKAIAEMYNQKSSALIEAVADMPASGMIIRHLVLPGCTQDSKNVLSWIADNISTNVHISLMSQYFPPQGLQLPDQLGRCITQEEYNDVVEHLYEIGFHKGWVQDYNSDKTYKPDFSKTEAFETNK
ncbi:MAG: hypothetical protein J6V33_09645 [Bacteroidales bacterium]|nr:hypothetical protein [Bacteroidales bacterium]